MITKKGFTLIELLVVIIIIALLAVTAAVGYSRQTIKARETRRISDVSLIANAVDLRASDTGSYLAQATDPALSAATALASLVTDGYLKSIPADPKPKAPGHVTVYCREYGYHNPYDSNESFKGQAIGTRLYAITFGAEIAGSGGTQNTHPYNNNIYTASSLAACDSSRAIAALPGEK